MSRKLKIIQTIAKVCKILNKIAIIFAYIGGACCLIALPVLPLLSKVSFGGRRLGSIIRESAGVSVSAVCMYMIFGVLACIGTVLVGRVLNTYLKNELEAGTPFTESGAQELKKVSLWAIVTALVISILENSVYGIFRLFTKIKFSSDVFDNGLLMAGLWMLFLSLIFGYGAEREAEISDRKKQEVFEEKDSDTGNNSGAGM